MMQRFVFSCLSKYLRTMHILFVALERPRESRLEHNCFKCVAFERDAKCQGTISVAFVKKFWKRCISWRACSSHHQIFFGFSICQTHAKHGKMRALAASHETCKMAKTRTKKRAKRETVSGHKSEISPPLACVWCGECLHMWNLLRILFQNSSSIFWWLVISDLQFGVLLFGK